MGHVASNNEATRERFGFGPQLEERTLARLQNVTAISTVEAGLVSSRAADSGRPPPCYSVLMAGWMSSLVLTPLVGQTYRAKYACGSTFDSITILMSVDLINDIQYRQWVEAKCVVN
jgi:hypothetical protein